MLDKPRKRIMVVGAGWDQAPIIKEAKRQGHYVIAADGNPNAYGLQFADKAVTVSTRDKEGILAVATEEQVDALTYMITESPLYAIGYAAAKLGLPAPSQKAVEATVSKPRMREIYRDAGIPNPKFGRATNLEEAVSLTDNLGFPLVIKSADVGGQLGLYCLDSVNDLQRVFEESQSHSVNGEVILEQFLAGPEINVVAVVVGGQIVVMTVSDRIKDPKKGFGVVMEHVFPSTIDEDVLDSISSLCQRTVEAMELKDAIVFPQLIVTQEGPFVVETGVRIPGGVMMELFQYATGLNLVRLQLDISLGNPIDLSCYREHAGHRAVMVKFINGDPGPLKSGKVQAVTGRQGALDVPGVVEAEFYNDPTASQEIRPLKEGRDRFYQIIAVGENRGDVIAATRRATKLLDFLDQSGSSLKARPC